MVVTHADDGVFSVYGYSAVLPHTLKKYVKLYTSALASKTVYLRQSGNQHGVHISATKQRSNKRQPFQQVQRHATGFHVATTLLHRQRRQTRFTPIYVRAREVQVAQIVNDAQPCVVGAWDSGPSRGHNGQCQQAGNSGWCSKHHIKVIQRRIRHASTLGAEEAAWWLTPRRGVVQRV